MPPALFTALRWGGALVMALPFAWRQLRRDWPALRARWWVPVLLGLLGVVLYNSLVYRGLHDTTAVNALLLQSATPLIILVVAFLLFGERPGWVQVAAILISVVGVVVIAAEGSLAGAAAAAVQPGRRAGADRGALLRVYSALLRLKPAVHPLSLLAASMAFGVVFLVPLAWAEHAAGRRLVVTPLSVACLAYAVVFPAFLAYLCFNRGVELVGAARAGQFSHLMPAFGIVLAVLFLGERLHPYHGVGIGLIGAGSVAGGLGRAASRGFSGRPAQAPMAARMKAVFRRGMRSTAAMPRSRAARRRGLSVLNRRSSASVAASMARLAGRRRRW